jgi:hypothetical protein
VADQMQVNLRPIQQSDRVTIPGPAQPRMGPAPSAPDVSAYLGYDPTHIILTEKVQAAGILMGNRTCFAGDVLAIEKVPVGADGRPVAVPVTTNILMIDRARLLIKLGLAVPHPGPASVRITNPTRDEAVASVQSEVERADLAVQHARAERADAKPQRRGAM